VRAEHAAHFFELGFQFSGVSVAQIMGQDQVVTALLQGSLSDIHETSFVGSAVSAEALGDVRWNGNRCSAHLCRQAIGFLSWEASRKRVIREHKFVRFAPHEQVAKASGSDLLPGLLPSASLQPPTPPPVFFSSVPRAGGRAWATAIKPEA
jgi:hypothetical protein